VLHIEQQFLNELPEANFASLMALPGKVYRQLDSRQTLRFELAGKGYFIKKHFGVGWREIIKNLYLGKLPVISANNERLALQKLAKHQIKVPKLIAYGSQGTNPATRQSFIIMEEVIRAISLEDLCRDWAKKKPNFVLKQRIIQQVGLIVNKMHRLGINHRDCYLCHFLFYKPSANEIYPTIYLIDLHRAQLRKQVPVRWIEKDLAGLYFSSMAIGLTKRDLLRFLEVYFCLPWRKILQMHSQLLKRVENKAHCLYQKEYNQSSPLTRFFK